MPKLTNKNNKVNRYIVNLLLKTFNLPKFTVVAVVVGQPPKDDPKPNCGLFKK